MSAMMTLDQLAALGGDEGVELNRKSSGGFVDPFEFGKYYPVEITEQDVSTTKNGYFQVALKLTTVKSDGTMGASAKRWVTLPVFSPEMVASADPEKLKQLKDIFGERLHQLLRGVDPETFAVYARGEKVGTQWHFYDANGNEYSKAEKVLREKMIGQAVVGAATLINAGKMSLVGKRCFYVRTQDKKNPEKTYDNFYSFAPDRFEAAEV